MEYRTNPIMEIVRIDKDDNVFILETATREQLCEVITKMVELIKSQSIFAEIDEWPDEISA